MGSGDATDAKPRSRSMSSMSPPGAATKVLIGFITIDWMVLTGITE